jgi:hypothetical protein
MHTERVLFKGVRSQYKFCKSQNPQIIFWFSDLPLMWRWRCADPIFIVICRLNTSASPEIHTFSLYNSAYNALIQFVQKNVYEDDFEDYFETELCSIFVRNLRFANYLYNFFGFTMCGLAHLRNLRI